MSTLYDIINILPFSLLAVMFFGKNAGIPEGKLSVYIICIIFSVSMIILRNMSRKNRLRSIGIVTVFAAGLVCAAGEEYRKLFINEYLWVIWILCFSVIVLTAGILTDKNIWLRRAAAAALLIYCIVSTVLERDMSKEAFALICFVILVRIAEEVQIRWNKSGCCDIKEHITRISPFFLVVCLIVYMMPSPDKPYDWKFAKAIYQSTVSCINRLYGYITHPDDDYGRAGFSDNGSFLSGLSDNQEEVLSITADNKKIGELRLVGCISCDFNGRKWNFDTQGEGFSRMLDTMETACAVRKYASFSQSDYYLKTDLNCETLFYNTRYIFSPAKIRLEATKKSNSGINEKNGSIFSEKRFGYRDDYVVSCYVLNYNNPKLPELLINAGPVDEEEWKQAAIAENVLDKKGYTFEDYQEYRRDIYTEYCHTYGLSEKVGELLEEIKRNSSNRFEAMKILEAYLKGMEYSTDCGPVPDSVTDAAGFLDYFLFTSKKGYCMHYATAFTLMANEMGVPCRYVQGYYVQKGSGDNIIVKQSDAHAWPEVYFDNAGWVAFEPTPGYSGSAGWETDIKNTPVFNNENPYSMIAQDISGPVDVPKNNKKETAPIDPLIFIIPSLAVISFLILFYIIGLSISGKKYRQMSPHDKFRYLTQKNLRFMGYLGFGMEADETLSEYYDRIMSSDRQELKENLGFIPIYETALYSDREITEKDLISAEKIHNALRGLVKKSKLRYRLLLMIKKQ